MSETFQLSHKDHAANSTARTPAGQASTRSQLPSWLVNSHQASTSKPIAQDMLAPSGSHLKRSLLSHRLSDFSRNFSSFCRKSAWLAGSLQPCASSP